MFDKLASDKLEEYNIHAVSDWKQSFAVTPNNDIHSYLESLDARYEGLSKRSDIPKDYNQEHVDLIKETASVR